MANKKAVEMSLSVIIIAVILLLVLVVVGYLLFKGSTTFQRGIETCDQCVEKASECESMEPKGDYRALPMKCDEDKNFCCKNMKLG